MARLISDQKERVNPSTLERTIETKATYSYDPLGRRIQKDVDGEITQFAWLGQQLINESGSGAPKSYQYGPQGYALLSVNEVGSVLSEKRNGVERNGVVSCVLLGLIVRLVFETHPSSY
ncbi:hypothetical protein [Vibrio scophthalmi]|uniref:Rhs family protein n=1 Tax=Vibrio scophthalmi LMG 19158 TaxID=870967 RepID=F9RS94_9VIBR|nr:hypothetical protein [Vibrio scophthalmi]EGU32420.1 Rhs family protein [Vibrio scophthalmi LMG 19158]